MVDDIRDDFEKKWEEGSIEGWNVRSSLEKEIEEAKKKQAAEAEERRRQQINSIYDIDDDETPEETPSESIPDFSSVESIEKMGADKIKEILKNMGAKCGYVLLFRDSSFIHSQSHSLIHSYFTHYHIHSFTISFIHYFTHSLFHSLIHSLIHSLFHSFTISLSHSLFKTHSLTHSFF